MTSAVSSRTLRCSRAAAWALAVVLALAAGPVLAQSGSWNVDADGTWNVGTNWLNNTIAGGLGNTATFANDIAASRTITLNTNRALGGIVFGDANTASAASWILTTATGNTLAIDNRTNSGTITVNALGAGATATISTVIISSTSPSIVKNGVGTLVLTASNNFANKLAIADGTLQVGADRNLGVVGTFAADRITISNGATLRTSAAFTLNAARGITIGSGGGTISVNGGLLGYGGRFTGAGNTATVTGSAAMSLLNNSTGGLSDVNWDFASTSGARAFFEGNGLGTGSVRVRNGVRLTSQVVATGTVSNAVTLDQGAGLTARQTGGAVTYTNVIFPSTGTIFLNKDDALTSALTISSGGALAGNLNIDTSIGGTNAVGAVFLDGVFSGSGALLKSGTGASGRLVLRGANTYTGNTTISTGTLALGVGGSIANSAAIVLSTGSTTFDVAGVSFALGASQALVGLGTVSGAVTSDGTIAPGLSGAAGTLSFAGDVSLGSGSILNYHLSGTDRAVGGGVNDLSSVTGNLALGGTLYVSETVAGSFLSANVGDSWRLFNYTGTLTNNGLSLGSMPALSGGNSFQVDTSTANQVNLVVVPEPATIATVMVGLGMLGAAGARKRLSRVGS